MTSESKPETNSGGTPIGFSTQLPRLQTKISSTTLGQFKRCPRLYYYTVILGRTSRDQNIHLVFGTLVHRSVAHYELERVRGKDHEEALRSTLRFAAGITWNKALQRPWVSNSTSKNRDGLLRTLVWYLDHYSKITGLSTIVLATGSPGIEIQFEFDSGFVSPVTGESVVFVGTLDRLVRFLDRLYIIDIKTTGRGVGTFHAKTFTPGNQFSLYSLAGNVTLEEPVAGIFLDAIDIGTTYSTFQRTEIPRSEDTLNEWLRDSHMVLEQMSQCAERDYWPMNDTACYNCDFRDICSSEPKVRDMLLERQTVKKSEVDFANL